MTHAVFYHKSHWFEYAYSHSNYFLGISEYSKIEAVKSGYDFSNHFVICGPLNRIFSEPSYHHSSFTNDLEIGIALSGISFEEENLSLIEMAKNVFKDYKVKLRIRPHPSIANKVSDYLLSFKGNEYSLSKESLAEYASKCSFVITGNTNLFADLITMGVPAFRYINSEIDFFEDIKDFKFSSYNELRKLIKDVFLLPESVIERMDTYKKFFTPQTDITQNYISFFNTIRGLEK